MAGVGYVIIWERRFILWCSCVRI